MFEQNVPPDMPERKIALLVPSGSCRASSAEVSTLVGQHDVAGKKYLNREICLAARQQSAIPQQYLLKCSTISLKGIFQCNEQKVPAACHDLQREEIA